jgi:predicted dehydrogenase
MRIAFAGLATSHPYADARALPVKTEVVVWEPDQNRRHQFLLKHPEARSAEDLSDLLATKPDGVVLTVPTPDVAACLGEILSHGRPCFVTKPAAATVEQIAALDRVVRQSPERVLSTSVLRFAPAMADAVASRAELAAARVTVRHDVGLWARGHNRWADTPAAGGGMLATMGIHGVELLVSLLGPSVRLVSAAASVRRYPTIQSEDTGLLTLQWEDGVLGTVEVLGSSDTESYEVALHHAKGTTRLLLDGEAADAEEALGYSATRREFLRMISGEPSPVPWSETRAVLRILAEARSHLSREQHGTPCR